MAKNLSQSTLKNIRKEGCFINRMLSDGTIAECVANADGYVFECPLNLLKSVRDIREYNGELYSKTSRRCGCGHPTCDMDSITVKDSLERMGITVSIVVLPIYTYVI